MVIDGVMRSYTFGPNSIAIIGRQPKLSEQPERAIDQAELLGAKKDKVARLIVASGFDAPGHKLIVHNVYDKISEADGVLLTERKAAGVIQTADCAALALYDEVSGNVVLAHAGRPALTPTGHCKSCTVVANALHALIGNRTNLEGVHAIVVGNICGKCFKHDHKDAKHLIEPFMSYPESVFADRELGALDLFQVIKHMMMHAGVPEENIQHEGACTLETLTLSSYRGGDHSRNTIIVNRHQ